MAAETPFRVALTAVFVVTMAIVLYHRFKARTGEPIDRRQEGLLLAVTLRLSGLALWLIVLAYLINPHWVAWSQLELPAAVRWLGAAVGMAAALMMAWTLHNLGQNLTDSVVTRSAANLVTSGPYRWIRHPFYVSFALLIVSAALLAANWLIALAGAAVFVLLDLRTPKEERRLLDRFGDDYRNYAARTGKYLPRLTADKKRTATDEHR